MEHAIQTTFDSHELVARADGEVSYVADAALSDEGLGSHLERTVWRGARWSAEERCEDDVSRLLSAGAMVAASRYVGQIGRMTLGLLGPVRSAKSKNTVYFRPFGWRILKIMGFGDFELDEQDGEVWCGVRTGFLAARHVDDRNKGRLYFRWRWDASSEQEVFETEVRDYTPRLMGKRKRWWGRMFYRLTQVNFHKLVMWGYHRWVRRHREELLLEAAKKLENKSLPLP